MSITLSFGTTKLTFGSMRGYQVHPGPATQKLNKAPFRKLVEDTKTSGLRKPNGGGAARNDQETRKEESKDVPLIDPETNAVDLEEIGFANLYVDEQ